MTRQLNLFSEPAHANARTTKRAAAVAIRPTAGRQRMKVLAFLQSQAAIGATDEQIQLALDLTGNSERPRRKELETLDLIEDSGDVRPTVAGRAAVVWRVTAKGQALNTKTRG